MTTTAAATTNTTSTTSAMDPTSLLEVVTNSSLQRMDDKNLRNKTNRLILQGPTQCGKTSLLMDVAYSIAASYVHSKDEESDESDDNDSVVTFLTPTRNKSKMNTSFPLICSSLMKSSTTVDTDNCNNNRSSNMNVWEEKNDVSDFTRQELEFQQKMNELEEEERMIHSNQTNPNRNDNDCHGRKRKRPSDSLLLYQQQEQQRYTTSHPSEKRRQEGNWNTEQHARILQKIKIRYMDSVHDLFQYLASMSMKCFDGRNKAIIIDDLDYFIRDHDLSSIMTISCPNESQHPNENHHHHNEMKVDHDEGEEYNRSISKALFQDNDNDDVGDHNDASSPKASTSNLGKRNKQETNGVSTIEMMRLVQLCKY